MSDLVSLEQAKRELRLQGTSAEDDVIQRKVDEAQALVVDYVSQRLGDDAEDWATTVEAWTEETAPAQVTAAILELTVALYRFRGDDETPPSWYAEGRLPPGVRMKLGRFRDPAIA